MSYLVKMKMPVLGDASLCVDDCNKEEKWKVVVFSHGLGSNLNNYSALCGWWATHGYIVVSIQHHHDRVRLDYGKELLGHHDILEKMYYDSRNGDLRVRTAETQAVLLQLTAGNLLSRVFKEVKSLAVEEVYLAGHSFGGTTVLETLANLRRTGGRPAAVKGVIGLDAWFFPLSESTYEQLRGERMLLLNSETFFTVTPYFYYMEEKMERLRQNNPAAQILMVRSTDHLSISDFAFAMGTLLQLLKAVRLQQLSEPILELHEVVISLFMEGRSKQEVLSVSHKYAHDRGLIAKGVEVVKEWRFVRAKQN
jgi:platelet-activating factor acetylhydrolase